MLASVSWQEAIINTPQSRALNKDLTSMINLNTHTYKSVSLLHLRMYCKARCLLRRYLTLDMYGRIKPSVLFLGHNQPHTSLLLIFLFPTVICHWRHYSDNVYTFSQDFLLIFWWFNSTYLINSPPSHRLTPHVKHTYWINVIYTRYHPAGSEHEAEISQSILRMSRGLKFTPHYIQRL